MEDYVIEMLLREWDRIREMIVKRKCVRSLADVERLLGLVAHEPLSLADTLSLLNEEGPKMGVKGSWGRTKLYDYIASGLMPGQHHVRGFKTGAWYRDEVLMALTRLPREEEADAF